MPFNPDYANLTAGPFQTYVSRPDLSPPLLNVNGSGSPGYIFIAHRGTDVHQSSLVVADNSGNIVYVNPSWPNTFNFEKQHYQGQDVLTFWNGSLLFGYGEGTYIMMDDTLNQIAEFTTLGANVPLGDIHEFHIVNDTALVTIYESVPYDLSPYGGSKNGFVWGGRFQRIDLCTTSLIFEWRSVDHITPSESYSFVNVSDGAGTQDSPWDYFHINSLDLDPTDGSYLVSARHTSAIYKVNQTSGDIIWRLGGRNSSFTMGDGTTFQYQHDARWRSSNQLSLFDNAAYSFGITNGSETRGLRLNLDFDNMSASLDLQLIHPLHPLASSQGNTQLMDNGHYWMGYGSQPLGAEYLPNGTVISQLEISPYNAGDVESYRMFKTNWTSQPTTQPDIALIADSHSVFVSWNGATEVSKWNVYTGPDSSNLHLFRTVPKTSFETAVHFPPGTNLVTNYTQVGAVRSDGKVMGLTQVVRGDGHTIPFNESNIKIDAPTTSSGSFSCLPSLLAHNGGAGLMVVSTRSTSAWSILWVMIVFWRWMF